MGENGWILGFRKGSEEHSAEHVDYATRRRQQMTLEGIQELAKDISEMAKCLESSVFHRF